MTGEDATHSCFRFLLMTSAAGTHNGFRDVVGKFTFARRAKTPKPKTQYSFHGENLKSRYDEANSRYSLRERTYKQQVYSFTHHLNMARHKTTEPTVFSFKTINYKPI
jgi:hypothetical protein